MYLENKLKTLETRPDFIDNPEYTETNEKLDKIYQEKKMVLELEKNAIGTVRARRKIFKILLNLEKSRAVQNQIRNILIG